MPEVESVHFEVLILLTYIKGEKSAGISGGKMCLQFGLAFSHVVLRPWCGYILKIPTTSFWDQAVNLQSLPLEYADPALVLLCPICALHIHLDRTQSFRGSEQLLSALE
ncbi:hypothetical protein M9458_054055, partial [Cirrhinus mrigala]